MEMRGKIKKRENVDGDFFTQSTSIAINIMNELYVGNSRWVEIDWMG